jgi:adenosyl cobinamide kinase/adenosyl cobinamide phosphate guanylyltransferase
VITLVLGGTRSGKSSVAEQLTARHGEPVTYVATLAVGDDAELQARVARHHARRPAEWSTIEVTDRLPETLAALAGTVLVDSLGPWVAAQPDMDVDQDALCQALTGRRGDTVVVSDEVGLGVHPSSSAGLRFRDALGQVNQAVAAVADRTLLVVAGRVMVLGPVALD